MSDLPAVGADFAGYHMLGVLGRGRTSVVYQARNPRLGNVIALKVLIPELAADDVFRTRFFEESRIAAALNHPNVIPHPRHGVRRRAAVHRHAARHWHRPAAAAVRVRAAPAGAGHRPAHPGRARPRRRAPRRARAPRREARQPAGRARRK